MTGASLSAAALTLFATAALRAGVNGRRRTAPSVRARSLGPGPPSPVRLAAPPPWLAGRLLQASLPVDPSVAFTAWAAALVVTVTWAAVAAGAGAAALAVAVGLGAPCLAWHLLRHRGSARLEAALPAAVEAVAAGLRSGASLRQALDEAAHSTAGDLGDDLTTVVGAAERGATVVAALEGWAIRRPLPGVRLVVAALCLGAETGGATARAVDAVAATLRQRLAVEAEARALATQARISAAVIAAAPLAFCALSVATDPRASSFLLRTPTGLSLVAAGLGLDAAGALWMARLTRLEP